jgi:hypothetical protein
MISHLHSLPLQFLDGDPTHKIPCSVASTGLLQESLDFSERHGPKAPLANKVCKALEDLTGCVLFFQLRSPETLDGEHFGVFATMAKD